MFLERFMKYAQPLSLWDFAVQTGQNVMFIDVGTKKTGFCVTEVGIEGTAKKKSFGVKPLLLSSIKPFQVLWHDHMSINEASFVLDYVAKKHNVCGFYFGHPDGNPAYRGLGKGEFVNDFIVNLDGTTCQKGRLFSIVGEECTSKRAEVCIRSEYPNVGRNTLDRDYKDTYAAIEISEDFVGYTCGVRYYKQFSSSLVFDPATREVNMHLASHARKKGYSVY